MRKRMRAETYYSRGITKYLSNDYKGAIVDFNKAIELNPEYTSAYNNRGFAKWELGDHKSAVEDYNKVEELNRKKILDDKKDD